MAEEQVQQGSKFLLLAKADWHEGVLGIVASKCGNIQSTNINFKYR